jgi:ribose transport system substrate-binding protein
MGSYRDALTPRRGVALAVALLAAAALAGCGPSAASSGPAGGAAPDDGKAKAAVAAVTKLMSRPTDIGISDPIKNAAAVPSGKRIAYILSCKGICQALYQNLQEASAVFGWTTESVDASAGTPEAVKKAWDQLVAQPPDAIVAGGGFPHAFFQKDLDVLTAKGIPVVTAGDPEPAGNGVLVSVESQRAPLTGQRMAEYVIADSGGKAKVLLQDFPAYKAIAQQVESFKKTMAEQCPACSVTTFQVDVTNPNIAGATASQVQANRGTTYVVPAFGDMATGLPAALAGAGLKDVKIVTQNQNAPTIQAMSTNAEGPVRAVYGYPGPETMWRAVDAFARHFVGEPATLDEMSPYPEWFVTPANLSPDLASGYFPMVADYQERFKKLWGK